MITLKHILAAIQPFEACNNEIDLEFKIDVFEESWLDVTLKIETTVDQNSGERFLDNVIWIDPTVWIDGNTERFVTPHELDMIEKELIKCINFGTYE